MGHGSLTVWGVYVYMYVSIHMCVYVGVCMCVYRCEYTYVCICGCMYVCIFVCLYVKRKEGNVLFNDALNTFYLVIWRRTYSKGLLR